MERHVFTIGHSTHGLEAFIALLRMHGITAIADVRSNPHSRRYPQFDQESLHTTLQAVGIKYVFLGRELGARRVETNCYVDGKARYDLIARTPRFNEGIDRLRRGSTEYTIALLCAEHDPLTCHRMILVTRQLRGEFSIMHILRDGGVETNEAAETRLLSRIGTGEVTLFATRAEAIEDAYDIQGDAIAFVRGNPNMIETGKEVPHMEQLNLFTIGFTKASASAFFGALSSAGVKRVIDTRLNNVSQLAGFAKKDDLRFFLKALYDIDYIHLTELAPTQEMLDEYKKRKGEWALYETQFLKLLAERGSISNRQGSN